MDWQAQRRADYLEQQAEKERIRQEQAEQQRLLLRAQFAERAQREADLRAQREAEQAEKDKLAREIAAAANKRIAESLRRASEAQHERIENARRRAARRESESNGPFEATDGKVFTSKIEMQFWDEWISDPQRVADFPLISQFRVGRYRADFAYVPSRTIIELDSQRWHSAPEARDKDYDRQYEIEEQGWRFIRFTGRQVKYNVEGCVSRVLWRIQAR